MSCIRRRSKYWRRSCSGRPVTEYYRATKRILSVYDLFNKAATKFHLHGREIQLTRLMLTLFSKQPLLPLVKEFWVDNFRRRTCFFDLRRIVVQLAPKDIKEFYNFINETAQSRAPEGASQVNL